MVLLFLFASPLVLSLVDLYWWFWFDHKLTSVDWNYNSGIRVAVAWCMCVISVVPLIMLINELDKELKK